MSQITLHSVSYHYDNPYVNVFSDLTLNIDLAWRTGVIGRNGKGKSTLLGLIAGKLSPRRGILHTPVETMYFPYAIPDISLPTIHVIQDAIAPFRKWVKEMELLANQTDQKSILRFGEILADFEHLGGYEIESAIVREMAEIGLDENTAERPFRLLSAGEQTKALISALFLRVHSFPLIDEPTNHLDLNGRQQLADYLSRKQGFILVSHDRLFLDTCVDHVLSINRDDIRLEKGSLSQWLSRREIVEEQEKQKSEQLLREIRSLKRAAGNRRRWANAKERQKIGASDKGFVGHQAAKQMKRALNIEKRLQDRIEEKETLLTNVEHAGMLKLRRVSTSPERLLTVDNITVDRNGQRVLDDLSLTLNREERLAVIGPNGCGKTTLMDVISGELTPSAGSINLPKHLSVFRSHQTPCWQDGLLRRRLKQSNINETEFRHVMAAFGVRGDIFERPLETFSHGERKKIELCRSFLTPHHLLLWDEPLNYIDMISREQIEETVLAFRPSIIFVEHDRAFIDNIATSVLSLA